MTEPAEQQSAKRTPLYANFEDANMEMTDFTVRLPHWHVETMRELANRSHRGDLDMAVEWLIENYAMWHDDREAGKRVRPFGT